MGILNVTEDSFSDGGNYLDPSRALAHAEQMINDGADIIDVGGESTRPGATRVSEEQELARVVPVVRELASRGVITSVDTMRASVARASADAGVNYINDVSGGRADADMFAAIADTGLPAILMQWRTDAYGDAAGTAHTPGNALQEVHDDLQALVSDVKAAGVAEEQIILDPGLGFAKTPRDNWEILAGLDSLSALGYPLLIGASRKRFLQAIRADRGLDSDPRAADPATAALSALCAAKDVWAVRVHDVASTRDAIDVAQAVATAHSTTSTDSSLGASHHG
ncbi:dihydropteroate synthase [Corynebacterium argentoratense]|uniref:dihydropteroate synthase n=1 Tax=Corynebacterium argentoratense TaxID=42817 RepID=UPI0028E7BD6D|nr:dihydropteroate synthase [Corynebacterium argentoratense]